MVMLTANQRENFLINYYIDIPLEIFTFLKESSICMEKKNFLTAVNSEIFFTFLIHSKMVTLFLISLLISLLF